MTYRTIQLSKDYVERHLPSLIAIDSDTIGEKWDKSHFCADAPAKWECSWVAIGTDGPVGFVVASDKKESVHVHRIAVANSVRGQGVGRLLLQRVGYSAKKRNIDRITLRVAEENTGAIRFYARLGFIPDDPDASLLSLCSPVETMLGKLEVAHDPATTKKAKVLFVCSADISAAKLLAPQMKALKEAGFDVHVACSPGPYAELLGEGGFKIRPINIANRAIPTSNLASIVALYRLMRDEDYNIVHVHMISAAFLGRVAAIFAGVPLILYTFRGFAFYEGSSRWLRWFNLAIEKACRPFTHFYFSQSEENRNRAIQHGVMPAERSMLLGNGIALHDFARRRGDSDRSIVQRELRIEPDSAVVGYVGRLVREKGLFELVEAAHNVLKRHPSVTFLLVGDALSSDADSGDDLMARIRELGIESHFRFTGWRSDVDRLYQAMDVFVLPSYREGMPRSIMEAMATGKPVVATDIAGCRDQVVDGLTGVLVPIRNSRLLADAIIRLLEDPQLMHSMGEAGRKRAFDEFDERVVCQRLVNQYEKLIANMDQSIVHHFPRGKRFQLVVKRWIDYGVSLLCLVLLLPLLLLIGIAIKLDSRGPVFYRQTREGKNRRPFKIFKFRTMVKDAERRGLEIVKDDDRITRVGRLLRLFSLDELPQLLNVLKGEMSLVGPRPLLPGTTRPEEERRLSMRPGITSYPALFGRHALSWEDRMPIDIRYVDHWSLKLDFKILLWTIPIVLSAKNIYDSEGGSRARTMPAGLIGGEMPNKFP